MCGCIRIIRVSGSRRCLVFLQRLALLEVVLGMLLLTSHHCGDKGAVRMIVTNGSVHFFYN